MSEVFGAFLVLGLTSFGGPIAHLGFFRREFVERRAWLDERLFSHFVACCSILPGPTSSQVGMLVGLARAGPGGALAAWLGFTLPSALAMTLIATVLGSVSQTATGAAATGLFGLLAGLGAAATAAVAQAVLGMATTLCTDRATRTIALGAAALALALAGGGWQWVPIAAGALAGLRFCAQRLDRDPVALPALVSPAVSLAAGGLFVGLVVLALAVERRSPIGFFVATLVRAGALGFGGGHVVLPLLRSLVPAGLIAGPIFFAGYGATQAMPGPLFTFAAFLGSANHSAVHGAAGAAIATVVIFIPSFLLLFALWPAMRALQTQRWAGGALRGANAGVVGLLAALLYSPLLLTLSSSVARMSIALLAFALIAVWKTPAWMAVVLSALLGVAVAAAGLLH